jgi:agmatine/peptidylarginine deiminase
MVGFNFLSSGQNLPSTTENNYYTQANSNRTAAEWEPAIGTMVSWPLSIPSKLAVELSEDNHLFTIVKDSTSRTEAMAWYSKWGINADDNTFVIAPQGVDSWWTRDWGPSAVFTSEGQMKLGDGKYIFSTPVTGRNCTDSLQFLYQTEDHKVITTEEDDNATVPIGNQLKIEVLDLPFINTGGNVLTDGIGTAFSMCILTNENRYFGVDTDQFLKLNKSLLGIDRYHFLSNFEKRGIQHIDCFLKLLDEERILVIEPPKDHELYQVYEDIVNYELSKLTTPYGRPYEILRLKTNRTFGNQLAAYSNSIIVNKTIYVPLFRIDQDKTALARWQEVMPGYTVKGFTYALKDESFVDKKVLDHYKIYGWNHGDALHCRTRAIWDKEMLFISVKKINSIVDTKQKNVLYTTIIDYSKKGVNKSECFLMWRKSGEKVWQQLTLLETDHIQHFKAEFPDQPSGTNIEYYISATSNSGKTETQPRTAPLGFYSYSVE